MVRSAATQFASLMKKLPPEVIEGIVIPAIDSIKNHLIPLDETDFMLRDIMFHHFIGQEQFKEAAQTLASANLENFNDHDKTDIYVKCAGS